MLAAIHALSSFVVGSCCYHTTGRPFVSSHLMQVLQFVFLVLFLATCVTGSCWCRTINGLTVVLVIRLSRSRKIRDWEYVLSSIARAVLCVGLKQVRSLPCFWCRRDMTRPCVLIPSRVARLERSLGGPFGSGLCVLLHTEFHFPPAHTWWLLKWTGQFFSAFAGPSATSIKITVSGNLMSFTFGLWGGGRVWYCESW